MGLPWARALLIITKLQQFVHVLVDFWNSPLIYVKLAECCLILGNIFVIMLSLVKIFSFICCADVNKNFYFHLLCCYLLLNSPDTHLYCCCSLLSPLLRDQSVSRLVLLGWQEVLLWHCCIQFEFLPALILEHSSWTGSTWGSWCTGSLWHKGSQETVTLRKSMLVNKKFWTCLLIGWQSAASHSEAWFKNSCWITQILTIKAFI